MNAKDLDPIYQAQALNLTQDMVRTLDNKIRQAESPEDIRKAFNSFGLKGHKDHQIKTIV